MNSEQLNHMNSSCPQAKTLSIAIIFNFPVISPRWGYLVLLGCTVVAGRYWNDRVVIQSIFWLWLAILAILSLLLVTQSFWAPWDINSLWYKW